MRSVFKGMVLSCVAVAVGLTLVGCNDSRASVGDIKVDAATEASTAASTEAAVDALVSPQINGVAQYIDLNLWEGHISYVDFLEAIQKIRGSMIDAGVDPDTQVVCREPHDGYLWLSTRVGDVSYRLSVKENESAGSRVVVEKIDASPATSSGQSASLIPVENGSEGGVKAYVIAQDVGRGTELSVGDWTYRFNTDAKYDGDTFAALSGGSDAGGAGGTVDVNGFLENGGTWVYDMVFNPNGGTTFRSTVGVSSVNVGDPHISFDDGAGFDALAQRGK